MDAIQDRINKFKKMHPEDWEAYERICDEFWKVLWPILVSEGVISRRYYGKKKIREDAENGKIHSDTEDH